MYSTNRPPCASPSTGPAETGSTRSPNISACRGSEWDVRRSLPISSVFSPSPLNSIAIPLPERRRWYLRGMQQRDRELMNLPGYRDSAVCPKHFGRTVHVPQEVSEPGIHAWVTFDRSSIRQRQLAAEHAPSPAERAAIQPQSSSAACQEIGQNLVTITVLRRALIEEARNQRHRDNGAEER